MSAARKVYWIDPTQDPAEHGGFVPSVVTEGDPDHVPMLGTGAAARPWIWGTDLETAKQAADKANADLGIAADEARTIVARSMALARSTQREDPRLELLRSLLALMERRNDVSTEDQDAALEWAIKTLSTPQRPSRPYTVAYDDGDPEQPYVAQYTEKLGRTDNEHKARRLIFLHNNQRTRPADEPLDPRGSELEFRRFLPLKIAGFDVLHVDGWVPGTDGASYAWAAAVTYRSGEFSTHRVVWRHDDPANTWIVEVGQYGYDTLAAAREDLARRLGTARENA